MNFPLSSTAPVDPDALANNIGIVCGGADADCTSSSAEHVAQVVGDSLQALSRTPTPPVPEDLVEENRVVSRASRSWIRTVSKRQKMQHAVYLP